MAQILKFEGGGPVHGKLTYNGTDILITDELIDNYRQFGAQYTDDEKNAFSMFFSTLKKGVNDPSIQIVIDEDTNTINGVDWDGPNKNIKALSKDQTKAGEIITGLFRHNVKATKQVGYDLLHFNPVVKNTDYTSWNASEKIVLNHKYDSAGNIDVREFMENQPIKEARSQLLFFRDAGNLNGLDIINGYDGISRKEIEEKVASIQNYDQFMERLFNGSYNDDDEKLANYFGIFFDEGTTAEREAAVTTAEDQKKYADLGLSQEVYAAYVNSDGTLTSTGQSVIDTIKQRTNVTNSHLWLNKDFFSLYPEFNYLYVGGTNGIFIMGNKVYSADKRNFSKEDKSHFDAWVLDRRNNEGHSTKIYSDWFGDVYDVDLKSSYMLPFSLQKDKFIGAHLPHITKNNLPVYRQRIGDTFDVFGSPTYKYYTVDNGRLTEESNFTWTNTPTQPVQGESYKETDGGSTFHVIGTRGKIFWVFFPILEGYFGIDKDNNVYTGLETGKIQMIEHPEFKEKLPIVFEAVKKDIQKHKRGGKIAKYQNGDTLVPENNKLAFPTDFAAGIGAFVHSNISSKKYFDKLSESYQAEALGHLPSKPTTVYPKFTDGGLDHTIQTSKQKILNTNTNTSSDYITNRKLELSKNSQLAQIDLYRNENYSKRLDKFNDDVSKLHQQESIDNAKREEVYRKIYASIDANRLKNEAAFGKQKGENTQKFINEMRKKHEQEIARRSAIEDKMLQYSITENYNQELRRLVETDETYRVRYQQDHAKYNDDPVAFMKAVFPEKANEVMAREIGKYYETMINNPSRSLFPFMPRWGFPIRYYAASGSPVVTERSVTEYSPAATEQPATEEVALQKRGGKIGQNVLNEKIIQIFSKL